MRGRGGVELGSSPWELSTTAEVLVWRRKTKGKREKREGDQGEGVDQCSENHHLHQT